MTLTPEQFNLLVTKEDLRDFVTKEELDKNFGQILAAIDDLSKNLNLKPAGNY